MTYLFIHFKPNISLSPYSNYSAGYAIDFYIENHVIENLSSYNLGFLTENLLLKI